MPVLSLVSSKGGAGKTTAALTLAGEFAHAGRSVILIDADPNRPLGAWAQRPGLPEAISVVVDESAETIIDTIDLAREQAEFVIVDLEGTATDRVGFAISRSDLVLIPVQGSILDAAEAAKSVKLVRQMSKVARRRIAFAVLLSRVSAALRDRNQRDIEEQLSAAGIPVLGAAMIDRAAFKTVFAVGGTHRTLRPSEASNLAAAEENAFAVAQAVLTFLKVSRVADDEVADRGGADRGTVDRVAGQGRLPEEQPSATLETVARGAA